jgi:hypothetical protein
VGSRLVSAWLVPVVLLVACGRFGFEDRSSTAQDGAAADAPVTGDGPVAPADAKPDAKVDATVLDDGAIDPDAFAACTYVACGVNKVACCDSGDVACIPDNAPCTRRFECDISTSAGCTGGDECCLTEGSQGTECVDVLTEPCFG